MKEKKKKIGNTISTNINDEININTYILNIEKRANYLINEHYKKIGTSYNYDGTYNNPLNITRKIKQSIRKLMKKKVMSQR